MTDNNLIPPAPIITLRPEPDAVSTADDLILTMYIGSGGAKPGEPNRIGVTLHVDGGTTLQSWFSLEEIAQFVAKAQAWDASERG